MKRIETQDELTQFAVEHGLRADWHEPDEQEITARVAGRSFDNAGFWPQTEARPFESEMLEVHVIFSRYEYVGDRRKRTDLACVNLATLCAWASFQAPAESTGSEAARQAALG